MKKNSLAIALIFVTIGNLAFAQKAISINNNHKPRVIITAA